MSENTLFRVGGASAVVGALIALVANVIHPRIEDFADPLAAEVRMVAESDGWIPIHLAILFGTLLIAFGLFAVVRSLKDGPGEGPARVALGALVVSIPVAVVWLAVDGYAIKAVADSFQGVRGPFDLASTGPGAVAEVGWGLFMMLVIMLMGITPLIGGWAVAASGRYPAVLGWPVSVVGAAAVLVGAWGIAAGPSAGFSIVFMVISGLATLWVLAIGIALWRRAGTAAAMEAQPGMAPG
jgi:uncharacterized membrane protein YjgN (DUF898 family)